MVARPPADASGGGSFRDAFLAAYEREYGFLLEAPIVVDDIRVRGSGKNTVVEIADIPSHVRDSVPVFVLSFVGCRRSGGGVAVRAPVLWKYQAMVSLRFLIHDVRLQGEEAPVATETARIYFQGGWQEAGVFRLADLGAGAGMR